MPAARLEKREELLEHQLAPAGMHTKKRRPLAGKLSGRNYLGNLAVGSESERTRADEEQVVILRALKLARGKQVRFAARGSRA